MQQHRLWQGLWLSFYSKKFYQEIAQDSAGGMGLGYLLLLYGICALPSIHTFGADREEAYIKTFGIYLIGSCLVALLYAGIAKLFVRCHHPYKALCRLATAALTPAIYLLTSVEVLALTLPYSNLIYLFLSLGYLILAIHASHLHN